MIIVSTLLAMVIVLLMGINIGRGDFPLSLADVARVLLGGGDNLEQFIVIDLRLPRSLVGVVVGFSLGLAGAITQSLTRNGLASPDILGISSGASVTAVAVIVLTGGSTGVVLSRLGSVGLPLAALIGGLVTAVILYALAWKGGVDGFRLILIGIAITAICQALVYWMLIKSDINDVAQAQAWLVGSLNGRDWRHFVPMLAATAAFSGVALAAASSVNVLRLGDETARALGARVNGTQAVLLLSAVGLAAASVAAAGPIGFVGLMAPQVALRLLRSPGPPLLASGLVGAALVLAADITARTMLPVELPAGIVTAALGVPFLLYLLVRTNRKVTA
ncbi:iron chelate uptake ABC transporter family permease subunit [Hoyosella sp. G463]|uniref:Iron chelate uptake ABC transporter family permease subunit n=2 Tax=Lolliginicoccus lacisalsi TaxID=2742202 RepID=A0A927JE52_9ACTN|nr:iron chelate uptake ABC transporter family permease subunit [Lolliginicoccus lacisalsi]